LSVLINLSLVAIYFLKIMPHQNLLEEEVSKLSQDVNCTRIYSQSAGKFVCLSKEELRSESLSECSKNFREILGSSSDALKGLRDLGDLEKLRELSIKMCMQEKGYEYK